jgi:hypothetical protein
MWGYQLGHLNQLTADVGMLEHATLAHPLVGHGCCTDDNARLLVIMTREPDEGAAHRMGRIALDFVLRAQADSGLMHNRLLHDGYWRWVDTPSTEDHWGRALWGLGVAAAAHPNPGVRARAQWGFERSARQRSPWLRSMAFAALGAADLLMQQPRHALATSLLVDAVIDLLPSSGAGSPWPEDRLAYANGAIPEALIAAGAALGTPEVTARGLDMLHWLMDVQTRDGHLSVVGQSGRSVADRGVQFDQQPIEVAALADACWRAWTLTGDSHWREAVAMCGQWFLGENDSGSVMFDPLTGGGYDGLEPGGCNLNQGSESTIALVSTMQRARTLLPYPQHQHLRSAAPSLPSPASASAPDSAPAPAERVAAVHR